MIDELKQEQASLYVLGDLPEPERSQFEADMAQDPELVELVTSLIDVSGALALSVPQKNPSKALRKNLMALTGGAEKVVSLWSTVVPWALAACLAISTGLLGWQQLKTREALSIAQTHVEVLRKKDPLAKAKVALLAAQPGQASNIFALSIWDPERQKGVFTVENLPQLPLEKDYQLWVINSKLKAPVSAGIFKVDASGKARYSFKATAQIPSPDNKFAVSIEKQGGGSAPEGQIILVSQ